jgi:hypothetical protein
LGSLRVVAQAAVHKGLALDPRPLPQDGLAAAEVDVGGGEVAQALVSPSLVVRLDEGGNPRLQLAGQVGVFEPDAVLERRVPTLDLILRLRMAGRTADVGHAPAAEPVGQITRDVARPVVGEPPRPLTTCTWSSPAAASARSSVAATSLACIVAHSFHATM